MLMSAVLDPSAFDAEDFNDLYRIQAEDFLQGIWRNGVLIVDSERKLQEELFKKAASLPIKGNRLRTLLTDLLKEKSKRVTVPSVLPSNISSRDLLDLTCHLKRDTEPDGLIVGNENFEKLRFDPEHRHGIVPLSEYRDSNFEEERQRYCDGLGPIDTLARSEVDEIVIRSARFSKWLKLYDAYIGTGENTSHFRKGIEYILSLWREHGFFASQQGVGSVEIFTCPAEQIRDDETDSAKESKLERNQENYQKVVRELVEPLNEDFPWPIRLSVKDDPDGIFHARYLETQHAIIRIDHGFDLFKPNGEFRRNFFTLNMMESSHLRECRNLPDASV
ncbi:hypothetical protein F4054_22075 [Candidatus Poribacteria bacterium]|nr:hypothetical protein [Candidatus Poribacteria bacterium]MYK24938.1 hypothetical protein [Candidatus Poribacteria bacterium]